MKATSPEESKVNKNFVGFIFFIKPTTASLTYNGSLNLSATEGGETSRI